MGIQLSDLVENIVRKRENGSLRAIVPFLTMFSKAVCLCQIVYLCKRVNSKNCSTAKWK